MRKNVVLLCVSAMLIMTLACSGEGNDMDSLVDSEGESTLVDGTSEEAEIEQKESRMNIKIGERILTATLVDNSSVEALMNALSEGPITINMQDYGNMEKVGSLGRNLPRNDEQITTEAGDIILYQGNALVIYYAPNSWNFTRLGKIDNITQEELKAILGEGNVTVTLSLPQD